MRNSAETKAIHGDIGPSESESESKERGFSMFSIDEHRLSLGLLILMLLAAAGYGIWVAMAPFLPAYSGSKEVSRIELAESHFKSEDWNKSIPIYREMLEDDPDNGFIIQKLAIVRQKQLFSNWKKLGRLGETTGNSNASKEILEEESLLFTSAISRWQALRDNARYQRKAYEQLAILHSYRSQQISDPKEIDNAIEVLKEMLDSGLLTSNGIESTQAFRLLKDHPDFKRLVRDEKRNENFRSRGTFMPYQGF